MKFVLDASVAVAAVREGERHHSRALACVRRVLQGPDEIVVPTLFHVEVAAALARIGEKPTSIRALLTAFDRPPHQSIAVGRVTARRAAAVAMRRRLRAADALYVWIAADRGLPLVTLDREVIERASSECDVRLP